MPPLWLVNHIAWCTIISKLTLLLFLGYVEGIGTNARYDGVSGFVQLNAEEVVVADSGNYCLRLLKRSNGQTSTFAGSCTNQGNVDGSFTSARFERIRDIVYHTGRNSLFIIDADNRAIRELDIATQTVSTLIQLRPTSFFGQPARLTLDPSEGNIYFSGSSMLAKVNIATKALTFLTPITSETGFKDGALPTAKINNPSELIFLNEDTILIADALNQRLRVIDLKTSSISSICKAPPPNPPDGVVFPDSVDGNIRTCGLRFPQSLLYRPETNQILLGEFGSIRQLAVLTGKY